MDTRRGSIEDDTLDITDAMVDINILIQVGDADD